MSFFDGVSTQSVSAEAEKRFKQFKVGANSARISNIEEAVSKTGKDMLVITFANEDGAFIKHRIVEGDYKLKMLYELQHSFGIPYGETDTRKWIGKWGVVVCRAGKPNDKGHIYNEVHYLQPEIDAGNASHHQEPSRHPTEDHPVVPEGYDFTDDIPF